MVGEGGGGGGVFKFVNILFKMIIYVIIIYRLKIASKKLHQTRLFHTTALQLLVICMSDKEFEANLGYVLSCFLM